jgi:hypothetical protein
MTVTAVADVAARHAATQVAIARHASVEIGRLWAQVDRNRIAPSWRAFLPRALVILSAAQALAAAGADDYVNETAAADPAGRIRPRAFAGVASDGRPLLSLLEQPVITALQQIGGGASPARALASGRYALDMITRTQVADAGRVAVGTAIAARPQVTGYVRVVVGGACARCLILAGRTYRWNAGFARHPRCDCRHAPYVGQVPGGLVTSPKEHFDALDRAGQDALLGAAGAEAVRNGADLARVVNARRGMVTAADGRLYTTEAAGRRPRLMPEQIMREAGTDRAEAVRLLRLHGYIGL